MNGVFAPVACQPPGSAGSRIVVAGLLTVLASLIQSTPSAAQAIERGAMHRGAAAEAAILRDEHMTPAAAFEPQESDATRLALRQLMDEFVRGWREGDAALLSRVVDLDHGRITWVTGDGARQRVDSMTFRAAIARNRTHPEYGRDGWTLVNLDVVDERLAVAKLDIPEGKVLNVDYMVCYRVAGAWRIVSNTFVIRRR